MAQKLRVGIVGCGTIAATHIPYVRAAGGAVVGAADASTVRANDLADRFSIQTVYPSVGELIEAERPDVVHVLTPPHTHAPVAIEALERGVHVLVEKPMALDGADARAMKAAALRSRALLTVDHNRLFDPVMRGAAALVDGGALGDLVAVESYQAGSASDRPWLDRLRGGGLGDLLPHPLYLLLAFVGDVEELHAILFGGQGKGREEELRVLLRGSGCSGTLTISARAKPELNTLRLCGTRMTVEVDLNNMTLIKRRNYAVPKPVAKALPNLDTALRLSGQTVKNIVSFVRGKVRYYPGMGELIRRFYDAVRRGDDAPVSVDEGVAVVEVSERIWADVRAPGEGRSPKGDV